jgi:hypothetical protein
VLRWAPRRPFLARAVDGRKRRALDGETIEDAAIRDAAWRAIDKAISDPLILSMRRELRMRWAHIFEPSTCSSTELSRLILDVGVNVAVRPLCADLLVRANDRTMIKPEDLRGDARRLHG